MISDSELDDAGPASVVSPAITNERLRLLISGDKPSTTGKGGLDEKRTFCTAWWASSTSGLGVFSTGFFILTTIVFTLPLPFTILQTGLISGVILMLVLPTLMAYSSILVSRCWLLLQKKWPEKYRDTHVRMPYPAIAREAGGVWWERAARLFVFLSNLGSAVVTLLMAVSSLQVILPAGEAGNIRLWLLAGAALLLPFVWLGTPRNSWLLSWISGFAAIGAAICLLVAIGWTGLMPQSEARTAANSSAFTALASLPVHSPVVTFTSFWFGVGAIIFSYSGMAVFPSLQHDMAQPKRWPSTVSVVYIISVLFGVATAVSGYLVYGAHTQPNILWNISCHGTAASYTFARVTSAFLIMVNLSIAVISLFPVLQDIEDMLKLPTTGEFRKHPCRYLCMLECQHCV